MSQYTDLFSKATGMNGLGYDNNNTTDTRMLRGIGYALLALAQAIKDGAHEIVSELEYSRQHRQNSN